MASSDTALTTGADQNANVRRRHVPGTEGSSGTAPVSVVDEKDVKVHGKVPATTIVPSPCSHGVADHR